jgi:zinc finger protein
MAEDKIQTLEGQECPICHAKNATLMEQERDVPYFGKVYMFSITCSSCRYHKADVEAAEKHPPARYTLEVENEKDMNIRVVKSAEATVKIPHMITMEPGTAAQGFITNIEGLLRRFRMIIESARDNAEEKADQKKAKNMLKKLQKAMWGQERLRVIIEDPTGNSAIVSDRAQVKKLQSR